uniref:NADH-ubiquinone oxidoreductase chain 2 n=1 Tax=Lamprotula gottschei TaxID=1470580 RepID=W8P5P5_9BIVA|nr:NADH dehydrogenase subunit 2 [Lamprotula gottschei]AHL24843.1 NADH dehydrogenase subunit 2 [Lamprotula gottschei]
MKSPNKLLFMFLMISSTCMVASSTNWLMTWMGLEINMLGYIPLMFSKEDSSESEAAVKYLVPQSLGSTIFIASAITSAHFNNLQILMLIAMCLKLGAAPLHLWFPPVMASLQLTPAFILLTWQKIAPLLAINSFNPLLMKSTMIIAMISALWGGIGGLNQTDIRSLLTYSSISHTGWMLASLSSNNMIFIAYLITYILINSSIYTFLTKEHTKSHKQLFFSKEPSKFFVLAITILSLGGLPPLTGFIMKLLVIMFTSAKTIIIFGLIVGALVSLYYLPILNLLNTTKIQQNTLTKTQMVSKQTIFFLLSQILPLTLILFFF